MYACRLVSPYSDSSVGPDYYDTYSVVRLDEGIVHGDNMDVVVLETSESVI